MGHPAQNHESNDQLRAWLDRLDRLASDVKHWCASAGWSVHEVQRAVTESSLGTYVAPGLRIKTDQGEVMLEPVARHIVGADGRVDLNAWPSLNRVKIIAKGETWEILTDSNVPWPKPWGAETFLEIAKELASAP